MRTTRSLRFLRPAPRLRAAAAPKPPNGAAADAAATEAAASGTSTGGKAAGGGGSGLIAVVGVLGVAAAGGGGYLYQTGFFDKGSAPVAVEVVTESEADRRARELLEEEERKREAEEKLKQQEAERRAAEAAAAAAAAEQAAKQKALEEELAAKKALEEAAAAKAALTAEAHALGRASVEEDWATGQKRREQALTDLQEALAARDTAAIAQALTQARQSVVGRCAETQLAETIVEPVRLIRDGLRVDELAEVLLLPEEFRGLTEEGAAAAERAHCDSMDAEALRARVVELSRYLAVARIHAKSRIEETLMTKLEQADHASLKNLEEALTRLEAKKTESAAKELSQLEERLKQEHDAQLVEATHKTAVEMQEALEAEKVRCLMAAEQAKCEEQASRLHEVLAARAGLDAVEAVLNQEAELVHQYQAQNSLAVALLGLEEKVLTGHGASSELEALRSMASKADPFSEQVFTLLPEESQEKCRQSVVPTEPILRQKFAKEIQELVAVAFVPPDSGLLGEVLGRFFRQLYFLDGGAALEPADGEAPSEAKRNLEVLARASAQASKPGGLAPALVDLEGSLTGLCRDRAARWLSDMRHELLVRQALMAVKARVQCVTMAQL